MSLRHKFWVVKERLGIFLFGALRADSLRDKAVFTYTALRHMLAYSVLPGLKPRDLQVSIGGMRVAFREFTGEVGMYKEIFVNGIYGKLPDFKPGPGMTIFDIGANIGLYTLKAGSECPGCRIYSFEPNPDVFTRLCKNIELNDLSARAFNIGFADAPARAYLSAERSTVFGRISFEGGGHEVAIDTIDNFTRANRIDRIDLLKIDVEGFELKVLEGARETLPRVRKIMLESDPALDDRITLLLSSFGFRPALSLPEYRVLYFSRD
jgi:FkbM family methyltransferase